MFGFTIHKSQGMDILYLEIDCKFARLPGLTEIAVGQSNNNRWSTCLKFLVPLSLSAEKVIITNNLCELCDSLHCCRCHCCAENTLNMFVKMGFRQLCFGRDFSEQFYSQCPINSILPDIKDIPSETILDFIHFPAEQ